MAADRDSTSARALNKEIIRELLDYNPSTGLLVWRSRERRWFPTDRSWKVWNSTHAGKVAGSYDSHGYVLVRIFKKLYLAHRLIILWMTGSMPARSVDHINHKRDDNRWSNLRVVSALENSKNQSLSANNTSGFVGVCRSKKDGKWDARISSNGTRICLGRYAEKADAIAARKAAEREFGYHKNHGAGNWRMT
jgi:hypothetical protein